MILFPEFNTLFFGCFDPGKIFLKNGINIFLEGLPGISAKTNSLPLTLVFLTPMQSAFDDDGGVTLSHRLSYP